ncbi:protein translocase subunit SecF [Leptospira sp. GIMC2001]|uniref:protein translocase subunit SecF n=1 Tax=Leptospira sp. GIMC2001 TaxID=1513297 RepID=UPI002348FE1A|nr:protein translocase subunit SecF [Leptospira sp. GIMC2001]WCL48389.1 protein translocase subunit SecF [Leptospira sp. GIMC2001]
MMDFIKYKYFTLTISLAFIIAGFAVTYGVHGGFANSLDFNGGIRTTIQFPESISRDRLNAYFTEKKIEAVLIQLDKDKNIWQMDMALSVLDEFITKRKIAKQTEGSALQDFMNQVILDFNLKNGDILSADQVGAVVGGELTETGISLIFWTLIVMAGYLTFRFRFIKFSVGASLALLHDLAITLAMIGAFQIKPSVPLIAAILTLLGYSINDTIVIFDRIRENTLNNPDMAMAPVINGSIYQTLGRTINTSFATLISVVALIVGGAVELYDFAYVLVFGVIVGTYSSIFIAAPVMEMFDTFMKNRKKRATA